MKLLAIETSCDETAAAIVESSEDGQTVQLLSHSLATSLAQHATTGGIIPENAARAQIHYIIPTIYEALEKADMSWGSQNPPDLDAIAVTYGPGLIGSLLVGVETAKTLSYIWNKPLIPVNHLFGHMYANWIKTSDDFSLPQLPAIVLIVSGGHTDLLLMKSHTDITWLGGTRDDAAGEAFDKIGRLLGLPYPAGPVIEERAKLGDPKAYNFPRPLAHDRSYDFSFSGLKTAVLREVSQLGHPELVSGSQSSNEIRSPETLVSKNKLDEQATNNLARGTQDAIIDVLVRKTLDAAETFGVQSIILSGGVAANQTLRSRFQEILDTKYKILNTKIFVPQKFLCTDNAAMIGAAAVLRNQKKSWQDLSANPQLYFD